MLNEAAKPELSGKVALVTGGASGLGKAIAQRLASDGACVVISDVQVMLGQRTATELGASFVAHDVTDETHWTRVIQHIQDCHGGLHILVNNAGIAGPMDAASPENTLLADWRRVFAVNVEGVFLGCRAAIPVIHEAGGGSIVNISSIAGLLATPHATAYGASKAAVRQLTRSVAQHCAQEKNNIRCNSVHPGDILTPLWEEAARTRGVPLTELISQVSSRVPLGELTQPSDIAAAVAFLVSASARHVTGTELIVDGGVVNCDTYLCK